MGDRYPGVPLRKAQGCIEFRIGDLGPQGFSKQPYPRDP